MANLSEQSIGKGRRKQVLCVFGFSALLSAFVPAVAAPAVTNVVAANAAAPFRAMILHPTGDFSYHTHDLDYGLERNGVSYRHYGVDNPDAIRSDFARYDLVMCTPLVNLNDVFAGTEDAVRAWIGRGNALVVTDGCDGHYYNPWLATVAGVTDPAEDACPCGSVGGVASQFILDTDPPHPLRCFPEKLDYEALQWNALRPVDGWEQVATCSDPSPAHPVTAVRPLGRGLLYLSSMQQRWSSLPANLVANLRLRRAGLVPVSYSLTPPGQGPGALCLSLKSLDKPTPVQFRLQLASTDTNARPYWTFSPIRQPDKDGVIHTELAFEIAGSCKGPAFLSLDIRTPKTDWLPIFRKPFDIPPALTVSPPRYRSRLSEGRRVRDVGFEIASGESGPYAGFNNAEVVVAASDGRRLGIGAFRSSTNVGSAVVAVALPPNMKAGERYEVKARTSSSAGRMRQASTNFVVRAAKEHPGETIIDEDNTLLVDGKPFFPLGVYHLQVADYAEAAALGFNTVQTFQWMTRKRESLDAAQELGLKVIFENNEKEVGGHGYLPGFLRDHPALLMWYAPDEPGHEPDFAFASQVTDLYRREDPYHPIVLAHFNPTRFAMQAGLADVLAPECYATNAKGDEPYGRNVELMDIAAAASGHRKPTIAILFCCSHQTEEDMRVGVWSALAHDARGLLWYAWDESQPKEGQEGVGLKYHDDVKAAVKGQLAQIRDLMPALLAPVRRTFVTADNVHGIVCDNGTERTLLVINMNRDKSAGMPSVPEFNGLAPEALFGGTAYSSVLQPFESRAYRCRAGRPTVRPAGSVGQSNR